MLFAACVLTIEIAVATALLRTTHRNASRGASVTSFLIGLASACAMGLAVVGSFLWLVEISTTSDLVFAAFWLLIGLVGFAIGAMIKSARAAIALPCAVIAFIALGYGVLLWNEMAAAVAAVLTVVAMAIWWLAGKFSAGEPKSGQASREAATVFSG